jgi:hypothetical protein
MDDMGWSPVLCGSKPQVALAFLSNGDANPRRAQEASPSIVSMRQGLATLALKKLLALAKDLGSSQGSAK